MKQMGSKNVYVYPCTSYVGRAVSQAFTAAGHSVSGFAAPGLEAPACLTNVVRTGDFGAASAQRQLMLTADVVVYDLLGNEKATRDAVVNLAQQPFCGREVLFVAVSSPLVWAATRPSPGSAFTPPSPDWEAAASSTAAAAQSQATAQPDGDGGVVVALAGGGGGGTGNGDGEDGPWAGAASPRAGTGSGDGEPDERVEESAETEGGAAAGTVRPASAEGAAGAPEGPEGAGEAEATAVSSEVGGAGAGSGEEAAPASVGGGTGLLPPPSPLLVAPTFSAPADVARRVPGVAARAAFTVEQVVLRAARRGRLRTAVVCPGLLYGEGEDDQTFYNAFKAAWVRQCLLPPGVQPPRPHPCLRVYGRGTNILPTLHVADLAAYLMALAGLPPPPANTPSPAANTGLLSQGGGAAMGTLTPGSTQQLSPGAAGVGAGSVIGAAGPAPGPAGALARSGPSPIPPTPGTAGTTGTVGTVGTVGTASLIAGTPGPAGGAAGAPPGTAGGLRPRSAAPGSLPGPLPGGYFLVTDGSRCSQADVVAAIAAQLGLVTGPGGHDEGAIEYIPDTELHLQPAPLRSRMLLDLSLAATTLQPPLPGWVPSRPGGLPAHAAAVAAEFCEARRLLPLRVLVTGPPLSGKTHLARRLAAQYSLAYISAPLLLAAAADPAVAAAAGLNPAIDPSLLRAAQAEVAAGPTGGGGGGGGGGKDKGDKDGGTGWAGAGRVSAKTLGALLASALADPRAAARCRGFVLDGFPRSAAQARGAFHTLVVDEAALVAEPSHGKVGHAKSKGGAARETLATPANLGGSSDSFDVPPGMKLVPNPLTTPTHVIELDVGEEELRTRLAAVAAAAEEAVSRLTVEASALSELSTPGGTKGAAAAAAAARKPPAGGAAGGKGGPGGLVINKEATLAAALGHNSETGFTRRMVAYQGWRAEDAADLVARSDAAQAAWDAEQARKAEERARAVAETNTLKAKRRRARAAAAAAAMGLAAADGADDAGGSPGPSPLDGSGTLSGQQLEDGDPGAVDGEPGAVGTGPGAPSVAGPELPQHGGLVAWSLVDEGARYMRLANPNDRDGPLVTVLLPLPSLVTLAGPGGAAAAAGAGGPSGPPGTVAATVAAVAAAAVASASATPRLPPLASLERQVDLFIEGNNRSTTSAGGSRPSSVGHPSQRAILTGSGAAEEAAAEAEAAEAAARAAAAAEAEAAAALVAEAARGAAEAAEAARAAGVEDSYKLRWRGSREEAVRRYLMKRVMPVVTAALAEVALVRANAGTGGVAGLGGSASEVSGVLSGVLSGALSGGPSSGGASSGGAHHVGGRAAKEALLHVAKALQAAAEAEEAAFVDPYADPSYGIQLAKIEAKAAREAARAAAAAAKAEREAAARQQQQAVEATAQ